MKEEYYHTKESVEEYITLAKDVNSLPLIEKLKKYLPENASLLEIGSGPGTDWSFLNQHYKVTGSDYSDEFLKRLKKKHSNGSFENIDAITIETNTVFDGIYSNKVLQHLTNTQISNSIKRQSEVLTKEGIICHSVWKGDGEESFNGMYVNYFQEEELSKLFSPYFDILLIETYQEFEKNDSIVVIGKKK